MLEKEEENEKEKQGKPAVCTFWAASCFLFLLFQLSIQQGRCSQPFLQLFCEIWAIHRYNNYAMPTLIENRIKHLEDKNPQQ